MFTPRQRPLTLFLIMMLLSFGFLGAQDKKLVPIRELRFRTTVVASTNSLFRSLPSVPTVNEAPVVCFLGETARGLDVYQGSGGSVRARIGKPDQWDSLGAEVLIGPSWEVIFRGSPKKSGAGIFISEVGGPSVAVVADTLLGFGSFRGLPSINANGTICFYAEVPNRLQIPGLKTKTGGGKLDIDDPLENPGRDDFRQGLPESGGQGIFVQERDGRISVLVDTLGIYKSIQPWVSIANNESATFCATKRTGETGVFVWSLGRGVTHIASDRFRFSEFGPPLINQKSEVTFFAKLKSGGAGIYTGPQSGGPLRERARTDSHTLKEIDPTISVNDKGAFAFTGLYKDKRALFLVRADMFPDPILKVGDYVDELGVLKEISLSKKAINNRAQVACRVVCEDLGEKVEAIVLVSPGE